MSKITDYKEIEKQKDLRDKVHKREETGRKKEESTRGQERGPIQAAEILLPAACFSTDLQDELRG